MDIHLKQVLSAQLQRFLEAVSYSDMVMRRWSNQKTVQTDLGFCQKRIKMGEERKGRLMTQHCGCSQSEDDGSESMIGGC